MGKISNYARVLKAKLQDVFVIDSTDSNVTTTKSVTVEQIGDTIAGTQVHSDLKTDNQTIIGGINELAKDKNVADEYDDTHTYNTGDITIYGNTLYICNTNNTTGTFDPSNWTATTIDNVIGSLSTLTTTDKSSLVGAVNEVANQILYADVSIGNVSIGANGYADISNNANIPAIPTGYKVLFAVMTNFGSLSSKNGGVTIFTPHQGEYWVGSVANDSITGLEIRIVYIKN